MRIRSAALKPSSTTCGQTASASSASIAALNACCSSRNASMGELRVHDFLRLRGFLEQYCERRHIGVPFDERRHAPEERHRLRVERPDFGRDTRAVIVDAD